MFSTKAFLPLQRASLAHSLLACVLTAAATAASAGTACSEGAPAVSSSAASAANSVLVSYRDLDLATDAGSQALYRRITQAAHKVCAASDIRDLTAVAQSYRCERSAVSQAVQQVHSTRVAALAAAAPQRG